MLILSIHFKSFADIDECASEPCMHAADCADSVNQFDCTCLDGYTGTQCETGMPNIFSNSYEIFSRCGVCQPYQGKNSLLVAIQHAS